jgi:transcriptional regulator GlxA family with amidase domain
MTISPGPDAAAVYALGSNPAESARLQAQSEELRPESVALLDRIGLKPGQSATDLAAASGVSQRTLTRLFARATGMTPLRYQQQLRTERAEHLIGHGATVQTAARAAGFEDARMLRRLRARS